MSRLFPSGDRNTGHIPIPKPVFWQELGLCLLVDASSRCHLQITSHMNHELAAQKKGIPKVTSRCFRWKHRGMDRCWRTKKKPTSVSVGYIEADTRAQRGEEWGNWRQHSLILSLVQGYLRKSRVLCAKSVSHVQLFLIPWTVAHLAPLSMGFSRQNTGVSCYFLLQGIFLTQGLKLHLQHLPHWQADSLPLVPLGKPHLKPNESKFYELNGFFFPLISKAYEWWSC